MSQSIQETIQESPSILHPNGRTIRAGLSRPIRNDDPVTEQVFPNTLHGKLLNGLVTSFLIKQEPRMGWARKSACDEARLLEHPCETVAAHQLGVAWIVFATCPTEEFQSELPGFDRASAYEMAMCHDMAESVVGDYTPVDDISPQEKHKLESEAMAMISGKFPSQSKRTIQRTYERYEARQCPESKFVKDCDRLDFMITAFMLERQGFTGFEEFYINSKKDEFFLQISRDLAELLTETRMSLAEKGLLYQRQ